MQGAAGPCGGGDGSAADQNLAIRTELDFAARKRLADGSLRYVKRVVERDEGGGFRHAVALDDDKTDRIPEFFQRGRQRSAAADNGPELESERRMNITKAPPAQRDGNPRCRAFGADGALGQAGQGCFKMSFEQSDDTGNGGKYGDALAADGANEARRGQAALEVELGPIDGRNPEAHGLAKDVAEGQRVQDAQGVDEPQVTQIGLGGCFNGADTGQHVAVSYDDAFGIACGAGGEEDL